MRVKLLYFAWVKEKIGRAEESLDVPSGIGTEYAEAFARPDVVRAAIDQTHVKPETGIAGAREIAFFPPVTGG